MPSSTAPRFFVALLPSISNLVFVSLLVALVFGPGNGLLNDGDTGYHIRAGEVILQTWRVPTQDAFSHHQPPLKWTAHEWLSEVFMAIVYKSAGLTGIVLFFAVLLTLTHWLVFWLLRSRSNNLILITVITLLTTATSSSHWLARPHVFSLIFTLVWFALLDRFQYQGQRTLLYLPLLMLPWVNLHGGYFIGLVLIAVYIIGNLLHSVGANRAQAMEHWHKAKRLLGVLILTITACLINPLGYEILLFPARLTSDRFLMDHVTEFLSPNFHDVLPFKYMLVAMIAALALARKRLNLIEVELTVLLSYMALYSVRHVSLFAIIVAPILLKTAESIITDLPPPVAKFMDTRNRVLTDIDRNLTSPLWPIAVVLLVAGLALLGSLRFTFSEKLFPLRAVEFLQRENVSGNMFNNDEFGDYIIFAAWPKYRVFMDGRNDMYGAKLGTAYFKVANAQPGWKDVLKQYHIDWVIFDTNSALTAALREQHDWQPIYTDKLATIFVRKGSANDRLLAKFPAVAFTGSQ
jgi:hypothetical protein